MSSWYDTRHRVLKLKENYMKSLTGTIRGTFYISISLKSDLLTALII